MKMNDVRKRCYAIDVMQSNLMCAKTEQKCSRHPSVQGPMLPDLVWFLMGEGKGENTNCDCLCFQFTLVLIPVP